MKMKPTLIAGCAVLVAAVLLATGKIAGTSDSSEKAEAAPATRNHMREFTRGADRPARPERAPRKANPNPSGNVARWEARLSELESTGKGREEAVSALMDELAKSYGDRVMQEVIGLEDLPAIERHGRLVQIQSSVGEETAAVINRLGLDGDQHMAVMATAMQPVWAEMMYAGAASDPASRLGMMILEKERLARLKSAMEIRDYDARQQATAELSGWHQAELEAVLGAPAVP
jgi:hypothetical protein